MRGLKEKRPLAEKTIRGAKPKFLKMAQTLRKCHARNRSPRGPPFQAAREGRTREPETPLEVPGGAPDEPIHACWRNRPNTILELECDSPNASEVTLGCLWGRPANFREWRLRPKTRTSRILCASNIAILEAPRAPKVSIIIKLIINDCAGKLPIREFEKFAKMCSN